MMKEYVCNYSLIRFLPYRDAGEFVNIGVLLACGELKYLDFHVELKRYKRVTNFFPELEAKVYRDGLRGLKAECERWRSEITNLSRYPNKDGEMLMRHIFGELTRAQESVFHFSMPRTLLTPKPEKALEQLFTRYVQRQFPTDEVHGEEAMRLQIKKSLSEIGVLDRFAPDHIGTADYRVPFPFVTPPLQNLPETERYVIKPLNLERNEPSEITQHGDDWYMRIRRLRDIGYLPKHLLFPVQMPRSNPRHIAAAKDARHQLEGLGVETALVTDTEHLRKFTHKLPFANTQLPL